MNQISSYLLCEIFSYLDRKELLKGPFMVCKDFYTIIKTSNYLIGQVLRNSLGFITNYDLEFYSFKKITEILNAEAVWLDFKGFATSGGYDEDHALYWVGNLYKNDGSYYCSRDNKPNINTAGVLESALEIQEEPCEYTLKVLKECKIIANSIYPRFKNKLVLGQSIKRSFQQLFFTYRPQIVEIVSTQFNEPPTEVDRKLELEIKKMKIDQIDAVKFKRRPEDPFVMQENIDLNVANSSKKRGVICEVEVSREGNFTCPLETFIVLCSEKYVDIEDSEFDKFNDLKTYESLVEAFPGLVNGVNTNDDYSFCSIKRVMSNLKPIAWGKFLTKRAVEINIKLPYLVSGNFLYLKMINPENRMQEMSDMHDHPNIDANYVIAKGWVVNFSD